MTSTLPRILGQKKPDPLVDTNLFTVASGNQAQFSLFVCNQSDYMDRFTISLIPAGEVESPSTYIAYDTPLLGHGVFAASGLYLNGNDQVKVMTMGGNISITATGIEVIP